MRQIRTVRARRSARARAAFTLTTVVALGALAFAGAASANATSLHEPPGKPTHQLPGTGSHHDGSGYGSARLDAAQFQGVNWADPRDNFADDAVIPSGLSATDSPATTYAKARAILLGFRQNLGANTVRLPVNPYSVGPASSWWPKYREVIKAASDLGFKVELSYWEGPGAKDDGIVDDYAAWWTMWTTLTTTYKHQSNVYFEPMNEPHGYALTDWESLAASWLHKFSSIPRDRVFVSGIGYSDHVGDLCTDPALNGTYLALHDYGYWATSSYAGWLADFADRIGTCAGRTVVDEFGAPMTSGIDYRASATASDASTNNSVAFMQAATDTIRRLHLGAVYWPGLRTGDTYSLESLTGSGTRLHLVNTNPSAVSLLEWGWGRGHISPHPAY